MIFLATQRVRSIHTMKGYTWTHLHDANTIRYGGTNYRYSKGSKMLDKLLELSKCIRRKEVNSIPDADSAAVLKALESLSFYGFAHAGYIAVLSGVDHRHIVGVLRELAIQGLVECKASSVDACPLYKASTPINARASGQVHER